jgi:two-component system repressor protein LuxO
VTALPAPAVRIDPAESERRGASIRPLWLVEKEVIQEALRQCEDDVPKAATLLEISPSTIYRKLQQWKAEGAGKR